VTCSALRKADHRKRAEMVVTFVARSKEVVIFGGVSILNE
jgi:hypothetical protein